MFNKTPSYLWQKKPSGAWYLKLPIPPELQHHYLNGKRKTLTHIVKPLGTAKEAEAEAFKRPLLAHYWTEFERLRRGAAAAKPDATEAAFLRARRLREAAQEVAARPDSESKDDAALAVQDMAQDLAEGLEPTIGLEAAQHLYALSTTPGLTLTEALAEWNADDTVRESTKAKRALAVRELLDFLRLRDCLPSHVTDERAAAFVRWLNAGKLGFSTKQDRVSMLNVLWRYLARRRLVPKNSSPWVDHEITGRAADTQGKRGWQDDELLTLFRAQDRSTNRTNYTRPLFRELYALGLLIGARLDSIVSLTPSAVTAGKGKEKGGYWLAITNDKTAAGDRTIPVVHPVAVAILKRRLAKQKDKSASLFPECRPGGPDNNLSHHVSKALGRDRDRLGFGPETDFHSTRRCFSTVMENAGVDLTHAQRYIGHAVSGGGLMTGTYSDGASRANLMKVARAVKYSAKVERELAKLA
jgi:site-specific recombinase XerD